MLSAPIKMLINVPELADRYRLANRLHKWHLRLLVKNEEGHEIGYGNMLRPSLGEFVLRPGETLPLPPQVINHIENKFAFQVYHLVPAWWFYRVVDFALRGVADWLKGRLGLDARVESAVRVHSTAMELLQDPPAEIFDAFNSPENEVISDGRLGTLRNELLKESFPPVPQGLRIWESPQMFDPEIFSHKSRMTRSEAEGLHQLMIDTVDDIDSFASSLLRTLTNVMNTELTQALPNDFVMSWKLELANTYVIAMDRLERALGDQDIEFLPEKAGYTWIGPLRYKTGRTQKSAASGESSRVTSSPRRILARAS